VLDAAADLGLHAILGALRLIHDPLVPIAAVREIARLRGVLSKTIGLALIRRVTPYSGLVAMEEVGQDGGVMNVRRGRHYGTLIRSQVCGHLVSRNSRKFCRDMPVMGFLVCCYMG
jgi:hypothetical protein